MPIRIKCQCGKVLNVKDELAGKGVKCPGCGKAIRVPAKRQGAAGGGAGSAQRSSGSKQAAAQPRQPAAEGLDDLFAEEGFGKPVAAVCPACGAEMKSGAVLCTKCGFNKQTGERLEGHKTPGVDVDHGTLALQKAATDMQKDLAMQDKMLSKSGLPWWLLGLILFVIISGTSIAVLAVNAARREDEAINFDPLATFLVVTGGGFYLVSQVAVLILIIKAFQRRLWEGFVSLIFAPYLLYFCITQWRETWRLLITSIVTGAIAAGFFVAAAAQGAF